MAGSMKAWLKVHGLPLFYTVVGLALLGQLLWRWRREMDQQEEVRGVFAELLAGAGLDVPTSLLINSPGSLILTALIAGLLLGMALGGWSGKRT
ncbi:hypothetical protein [Brevundimonas sp.]|uniref:hypothetical protein n=1 Tax=Brevundimonas sp. TaxID=1871086 RepID=UPI002C41D4E2|nr:hypothetical protein [Brevundimonas sp.]HWQ87786.1 hypothetical protein [Brevundimonas sp.]